MGTLICDYSSPQLEVVGATKATTPVSKTETGGTTLVIPVPSGTKVGTLLIAVVTAAIGSIIDPPGWTRIPIGVPSIVVAFLVRIATTDEPTSHTWTVSNLISRSGCMIAIKGGRIETAIYEEGVEALPEVTNNIYGSMLVGLTAGLDDSVSTENITAQQPLELLTQHVSVGTAAYSFPRSTAIAVERNLSNGVKSGRTFDTGGGSARGVLSVLVIAGGGI